MKHNHEGKQDTGLQLDELTKVTDKKHDHVHTKDDEHEHEHDHDDDDDDHDHGAEGTSDKPAWMEHWNLISALLILSVLLVLEYAFKIKLPNPIAFAINAVAYLLAGYSVLGLASTLR